MKKYETPICEIELFETEDIMSTSGGIQDTEDNKGILETYFDEIF